MSGINGPDLDRWITGNYGEDQFKPGYCPECKLSYEGDCKLHQYAHGFWSYSDGGSSFDDLTIFVAGGGGATPKGVLGKPLYGPMRRVVF